MKGSRAHQRDLSTVASSSLVDLRDNEGARITSSKVAHLRLRPRRGGPQELAAQLQCCDECGCSWIDERERWAGAADSRRWRRPVLPRVRRARVRRRLASEEAI